jgi:hypothetical protein
LTAAISVSLVLAAEPGSEGLQAAKAEYERAAPRDEAARLRYVNKLAQMADRFVSDYRASGNRNDAAMAAINAELKKCPVPSDSDSNKLSQLLVGKWESPRHVYVFRANGKYGIEDGPISSNWRIKGNQLMEDGSRRTIILLNSDYFIYSEKDSVFFHSRVKE